MRVLMIEDNVDLAVAVQYGLAKSHTVDVAHTAQEGRHCLVQQSYDMILLDVGLPDGDGISLCRTLREQQVWTPILMLTAKDAVTDKVVALNAGADDYLTKPFHMAELEARVRALSRRVVEQPSSNLLVAGDLVVDIAKREVRRRGKRIVLRRKEFDLLECFMRYPGQALTRAMIADQVWGERGSGRLSNTIDVHVKYLRDKLDHPFHTHLIHTVPGVGYRFEL